MTPAIAVATVTPARDPTTPGMTVETAPLVLLLLAVELVRAVEAVALAVPAEVVAAAALEVVTVTTAVVAAAGMVAGVVATIPPPEI